MAQEYKELEETLYVHKTHGVICTQREFENWEEQIMEDWQFELKESVRIKVKVKVPKKLLEPFSVNVDIPTEFIDDDVVDTSVDEIEAPVTVEGTTGNIKITDTMEENPRTGFLRRIKKAIVDGWNETKETS